MSEELDKLAVSIEVILREGAKDFIPAQNGVFNDFAKKKAKQVAEQLLLSRNADTEAKRQAAETNLEHLRAQIQGEVARLNIAIAIESKNIVGRIFQAVIAVAKPLLKTLLPALPTP